MKFAVGGDETRRTLAAVEKRVRDLAASLGTKYDARLSLPDADADHLRWFDGGTTRGQPARPVFVRTPDVDRDVTIAVRARVAADLAAGKPVNTLLALQAGAQAWRAVWVDRLSRNGAGLAWSPLSPAYAHWKHRRGLDPRMGVARGNMLNAVRSGLIVVRRIG